jgi:uncharacterized protein YbjT (DUF2867 family)
MKVIVFGATGMVGQGVLRECLLDPAVEVVLVVGRTATGQRHAKLREILHRDFSDFAPIEGELRGYDACFYCLGVSSAGMKEPDYRRITYDFTMAAATTIGRANPDLTFVFVSGASTDSSERGRAMWARVKGKTENDLLVLLPLRAYMMRPGVILPRHGVRSKTRLYEAIYAITRPLYPLLRRLPKYVTSTEDIGRAMLVVARRGAARPVLENRDINELGAEAE